MPWAKLFRLVIIIQITIVSAKIIYSGNLCNKSITEFARSSFIIGAGSAIIIRQ